VLLLPEFLQISLRMTRWSSRSTTFRRAFVHHVRGPYSPLRLVVRSEPSMGSTGDHGLGEVLAPREAWR
jgi:hypothetical protein